MRHLIYLSIFSLSRLFLFSPPLLRTESSSTWRASTTRRWSTTLFWLTADTHTPTRTHSITATLIDAERGTAYRLASADRNHSSFPPPLFLPLLSGCETLALRSSRRRMDRQTEDQRPAVFTLGLWRHGTTALSSSSYYLYFSISAWLLFSFVVSVLCSVQYFVSLIFVSGLFLFFCLFLSDLAVMPLPSSLDLVLTLAAKLPVVQCYFFLFFFFLFLQFIHLRTNFFFILCNNVIFLFGTKVNAYLILCVDM